jgi:hypothetical protein
MTKQPPKPKRGPGRPSQERRFWLGVRIKEPLGKSLKALAKKRRTTMSRVVEEILQQAIDRETSS